MHTLGITDNMNSLYETTYKTWDIRWFIIVGRWRFWIEQSGFMFIRSKCGINMNSEQYEPHKVHVLVLDDS